MNIQFFKRDDGSSIDYIGQRTYDLIKGRDNYPINLKSLTHYIEGQTTIKADVGIMYGLIRDIYCLNVYQHSIAGLVCEEALSPKEIKTIKEAGVSEIWVPSIFVKEKFQEAGIENLALMPHGVDDLPLSQHGPDNTWRIGMIFNSYKQPNFHVRRKGIFETLQAFTKLGQDIELWLRTEDQPYYDVFKDRVNMVFVPKLDTLDTFYNSVHCILAPSHSEGFGLVGMESIARGKPLISTKTGNDYLTSDISYIHIDKTCPDSISDAVVHLLSNYDKYLSKAKNQREQFIETHKWEYKYDVMKNRINYLKKI